MQTWAYPAVLTQHGPDDWSASFPQLDEALTGGATREEVLAHAADALEEAILARMAHGEEIPSPRAPAEGETLVGLDPVTASRAALASAMVAQKVTNVALARRLGRTENAVRRLVDGSSSVKIDTVLQALRAVGSQVALAVI